MTHHVLPFIASSRRHPHGLCAFFLLILLSTTSTSAQVADSLAAARGDTMDLMPVDDGWFDASSFLDKAYGFLPVVSPITEPAVGYGAAAAAAFIDKPLGRARAGYGRPNITVVGGLGTQNGTWGVMAGDIRHWMGDRLKTLIGGLYSSVNLDYYGIGDDSQLRDNPLRYTLRPTAGVVQGQMRLAGSQLWVALGYILSMTEVQFDAPESTPNLPDYEEKSWEGGVRPAIIYDSRDNIFTPLDGTYLEIGGGFFGPALGGDHTFERANLVVMQYVPVHPVLSLGVRGDAQAVFGDAPFYVHPYIGLRGAPVMRYQGEETASLETELRWQFWRRLSLVGFAGAGAAWNDFERMENTVDIVTGGAGFRYELARSYGLHAGLDVAWGPDGTAFYIQFGSAWQRP